MSKIVDDLNDMGRELNDACEPDSGDMMFKAADLLAQVERELAEAEGQADYDRCTVDALVSDSKILTDKLAEAERERDIKDANIKRLVQSLHDAAVVFDEMDSIDWGEGEWQSSSYCLAYESVESAIAETPAISLANIEARAIEDSICGEAYPEKTGLPIEWNKGFNAARNYMLERAEDIRNSAKESNNVDPK